MQSIRNCLFLSRMIGYQSLRNVVNVQRCLCTNDGADKNIAKSKIALVKQPPAFNKTKGNELQVDWNTEMQLIEEDYNENQRSILAPVDDESKIYAEPMLLPSFNLAAYVQKSETLQQLLKLGVNLHKLDLKNVGEFIVKLDFKRDIEKYIILLNKDVGVPIDGIANIITQNPMILNEDIDNIHTRINYLQLKRFTSDDIVRIVTSNTKWLTTPVKEIDESLGFFQKDFQLTGNEVRLLTVTFPKLITHNKLLIQKVSFSIREECCFEPDQVKDILLKCPKLWMMSKFKKNHGIFFFLVDFTAIVPLILFYLLISEREDLMERYDFILNRMNIDNSQLSKTPNILNNRLFRIKERHGFLWKIKRAQYDPTKELYVSLDSLCIGTDDEFAEKIAKTPYEEYDRYLRTL